MRATYACPIGPAAAASLFARPARWMGRAILATLLVCAAGGAARGAIVTTGDIAFVHTSGPGATVAVDESTTVLGITFFMEAFVDRGSRTISNTSRIQAEFPAQIGSPGTATIHLSQIPISSSFTQRFGVNGAMGAKVSTVFGELSTSLELGLGLAANGVGLGTLTTITATDNDIVDPSPAFGIPFGILEATAGIRADVTTTVDYALKGTLVYQNRDTLAFGTSPFQIDSSFSLHPVEVLLEDPGIYDFLLFSPTITGTIDSRLQMSVSIFATIFGNNTPDIRIPIVPIPTSETYETFSGVQIPNWFSIEVLAPPPTGGEVPEPSSFFAWLCLAATVGIASRRWQRFAS